MKTPLALLGLVACVPTADPDTDVVLVHPARMPSSVPATYAAVPAGFFDPSCIAHVHPGETVLGDGEIRAEDGTIRTVPHCSMPSFTPSGHPLDDGREPELVPATAAINGWVESYSTASGGNLSMLSATWIVPRSPRQPSSGETVYFFNGLENRSSVQSILQPVLAYSGGQWTATSWNCCKNGTTFHASSISVNPGDLIVGTVTGAQCDATTGICASWRIETLDQNTGESSVLDTSSWGVSLDWAFAAVLEVYGIASCNELPSSGDLVFGQQAYSAVSGATVSENWQYAAPSVALGCRWSGARDQTGEVTSLGFSGGSTPGVALGASYALHTLTAPASCIDVHASGTANGTQIDEYACNGTAAQRFTVESAGTGVVRLHHPTSGKCIDVTGAGTANGTKIELYTCNGGAAQDFAMTADAAGNVTFKNPHSGKCLDVTGGGATNYTKIELYGCNGTNAQKFAPSPAGLSIGGSYELHTAVNGGASCMDVRGNASSDATPIEEYACNGGAAQELTLVNAGTGLVSLYHAASGKCVDVTGSATANGTKLQLWDCNGTSAQAFAIAVDAAGNLTFKNPHSGRCVDVTGGSAADYTLLQLWDCNGSSAQRWKSVRR